MEKEFCFTDTREPVQEDNYSYCTENMFIEDYSNTTATVWMGFIELKLMSQNSRIRGPKIKLETKVIE